jgi:hypothetical protein
MCGGPLFTLVIMQFAALSHATPSANGSPNVTWPHAGGDPCQGFYDQTVKSGHCVSPNKCVDKSFVGKWSVYAVPCDNAHKLYSMDENWGGAHITMTSFQEMDKNKAQSVFGKLKDALHPGRPNNWQPQTFSAEAKTDGTRRIQIISSNLDAMPPVMKRAGWDSPTAKGNWHVTMADLTGESFKKGDENYNNRTREFSKSHWALVLVECFKDNDGKIAFHRQDGLHLVEWSNKESENLVV